MKKLIFGLILLTALFFKPQNRAFAADTVCFCHNVTHNPVTICTDNQGEINGHSNHPDDTLGACAVPPTVPEFGLITGFISLALSAGGLSFLRRK